MSSIGKCNKKFWVYGHFKVLVVASLKSQGNVIEMMGILFERPLFLRYPDDSTEK